MSEIDAFATDLFEEAKRFLEKAQEAVNAESERAFLHAALLVGISSLEAHINAISREMSERPGLNVLDNSVLSEKEFIFDKGEFRLTNKLKMYNLTDRILFVSKHFSIKGRHLNTNADWWSKLHDGIDKRNYIVHPKYKHDLTYEQVKSAFEGILGCLDEMYITLYNQHFPALGRHLDSTMKF